MDTVKRAPLACCNNCNFTAEKQKKNEWVNPDGWGGVRVSPTHSGYYPNNITVSDLCPRCLKAVHGAVTEALKQSFIEGGTP